MMHPLAAMALVLVMLVALLVALRFVQRRASLPPELTRKAMHIGMGGAVLSFPWLFDAAWPVVVLGLVSAGLLTGLRLIGRLRSSLGAVIGGVDRHSFGELYYPLAVVLLFVISGGEPLMFAIPIVVLALADATAALIGLFYGRHHYTTADGVKSAEGSIAFFMVAFLSVHVPLLLFSDIGRAETLLVAAIIGLLIMLVEAASWRGLDNLFVPLGAYAMLVLYIDQPVVELVWRLAATLGLVGFVFAWRRRSSLDDSALICAALFGYTAWMLGGVAWLIAPLIVFVVHAMRWPRSATGQSHKVHAVLSVTSAGLVWLFVFVFAELPDAFLAYNVAFAAHLAVLGVSRHAWPIDNDCSPRPHAAKPLWHALWAAALALAPAVAVEKWVSPLPTSRVLWQGLLAGWLAATLAAFGFYLLLPWLYRPAPKAAAIYCAGTILSMIVSALTAGILFWFTG